MSSCYRVNRRCGVFFCFFNSFEFHTFAFHLVFLAFVHGTRHAVFGIERTRIYMCLLHMAWFPRLFLMLNLTDLFMKHLHRRLLSFCLKYSVSEEKLQKHTCFRFSNWLYRFSVSAYLQICNKNSVNTQTLTFWKPLFICLFIVCHTLQ